MLSRMTLEQFAEALAAATPTPGGGSASAQAGAMAASLIQMMCDLTLGREQYRAHEAAVQGIRHRAEGLRKDLLAEALAHFLRHDPAHYVDVAAGRKPDKEPDRFPWILLRGDRAGEQAQKEGSSLHCF